MNLIFFIVSATRILFIFNDGNIYERQIATEIKSILKKMNRFEQVEANDSSFHGLKENLESIYNSYNVRNILYGKLVSINSEYEYYNDTAGDLQQFAHATVDYEVDIFRKGKKEIYKLLRGESTDKNIEKRSEAEEKALENLYGELEDFFYETFPLKGVVLERNKKQVLINLGLVQGVKKGHVFKVVQKGKTIGFIKVNRVEDSTSYARIIEGYYRIRPLQWIIERHRKPIYISLQLLYTYDKVHLGGVSFTLGRYLYAGASFSFTYTKGITTLLPELSLGYNYFFIPDYFSSSIDFSSNLYMMSQKFIYNGEDYLASTLLLNAGLFLKNSFYLKFLRLDFKAGYKFIRQTNKWYYTNPSDSSIVEVPYDASIEKLELGGFNFSIGLGFYLR